jgi:hypothetical protein
MENPITDAPPPQIEQEHNFTGGPLDGAAFCLCARAILRRGAVNV